MTLTTATLQRRGTPTAGVTAPGDKRFRRPDVRPAGRRSLIWRCRRIGVPVLAASIAMALAYWALQAAIASRLFLVSRVAVQGNTRLSNGEVQALLEDIRGQRIFEVNLDASRRRLMESPWVADAMVRRVLPATIEVRLQERVPMAIARIGGELYLIDDAGVIMDAFGPQYREFDLPVVDGLMAASGGTPAAVDPDRAALARQFLDALAPAASLRQQVSQIDVANEHDLVVLLGDDPTLVHLGDTRFLERLRTYQDLAPTLAGRLRDIDYVDMRFDERVFVKSKGQSAPVAATK